MAIVVVPSAWHQAVGAVPELIVEAACVGDLIAELMARYPGLTNWLDNGRGALPEFMNVFVGAEDIRILGELATPLRAEDRVRFIPIMAGGD